MHLAGEPAKAFAILGAECQEVCWCFRTVFRGGPSGKGFIGRGIVWTLLDLKDDGVRFADDESVPSAGFDVDEGRLHGERDAIDEGSVLFKDEHVKGSGEKAHRFGGVWEGMAVGLHVSSRLQKVEETLDARLLASLNWLHDTEAGALAGSLFSLVQEVGRH
jgi:hypothetical protein